LRLASGAKAVGYVVERELAGSELHGIHQHAQLAPDTADKRGLGNVRQGLDGVVQLGGEPAEGEMVVGGAVQGEGEHRDVVDGARLDEGRPHAGRNAVVVGLQLLVEPHEALFWILTDLEPDDDKRGPGTGGGVEILHPGDFPEQFLHGAGDAILHLGGGGAGHGDKHIDHWHLDLRLLLAREHKHGVQPEQQ